MKVIETTLKNFSVISELNNIFPNTETFEYTKKGTIRSINIPHCPACGRKCSKNGWDPVKRKGLFLLKIGKFHCNYCDISISPDTRFWNRFIEDWETTLSSLYLQLRDNDIAYEVISKIMDFIAPMSKDSVLRRVFSAVQRLVVPKVIQKYQIVHYDEQHPKKGRCKKYRLTLICGISGKIIAEKLCDEKNSDTVKQFLIENLDTEKETIIITDDCPWYPEVFKEIWGNKVKHQLCLLHLNKLIMDDLGRVKTLQQMYNSYLLLDIFYDRSRELLFIDMLMKEEQTHRGDDEWLKSARKRFNRFVRTLEKMRRREKKNLTLRSLKDAKSNLKKLKNESALLDKPLQKRLVYIEDKWKLFTLFYSIVDCPHTNNIIENYFSSSLKTHRKKQFRTDKGLDNKMKLSRYKRNIGFPNHKISFLEWGRRFFILSV